MKAPNTTSPHLGNRAGWTTRGLAVALAALLPACATGPAGHSSAGKSTRDRLIQADKDFCALAQARGVAEAFREFAAEEATMLPTGQSPVVGRRGIFELMSGGPKSQLRWWPVAADLAASGDLGYTWGTSEYRTTGPDGKPLVRHGKYLTVWKKQPDGSWRFVVDIGNSSPVLQ